MPTVDQSVLSKEMIVAEQNGMEVTTGGGKRHTGISYRPHPPFPQLKISSANPFPPPLPPTKQKIKKPPKKQKQKERKHTETPPHAPAEKPPSHISLENKSLAPSLHLYHHIPTPPCTRPTPGRYNRSNRLPRRISIFFPGRTLAKHSQLRRKWKRAERSRQEQGGKNEEKRKRKKKKKKTHHPRLITIPFPMRNGIAHGRNPMAETFRARGSAGAALRDCKIRR